jgi:cytochrome c553
MVRLRIAVAATLVIAAAACTGDIVDPDGDPLEAATRAFDQNVAPTLQTKCASCHTSTENPQFMRPNPTLREGVLTFNSGGLVDLMSPVASRLSVFASSQAHATVGVNYLPAEAAQVTAWVELEALAAGITADPVVETGKVTPVTGPNTIDLTDIGLTGSKLTFDYQPLATGMYLSRIQIDAGTGGVRLVHPLFVVWDAATPIPDPIDRFSDVDLTVAELTQSQVGGGTAVFVDIPPQGQLSVHFKTATFANGMPPSDDGGIVGGGCKAVPQFTSQARPQLTTCANQCHGGTNAAARAATDMSKLLDDLQQPDACAQILSRVSKLNPDQSSIIVSVDPAVNNVHPYYKVPAADFAQFRTEMLAWINAEAAP